MEKLASENKTKMVHVPSNTIKLLKRLQGWHVLDDDEKKTYGKIVEELVEKDCQEKGLNHPKERE